MKILVAEDEAIIRLDLRDLLERAGFTVCAEAQDGEEAVELARREQPDLAILDVKMPRLDGIEAAKRIIDERPIPIVMLTAYSQEELVSRAVEAGVFGYLVKPFREADLLPAIHTRGRGTRSSRRCARKPIRSSRRSPRESSSSAPRGCSWSGKGLPKGRPSGVCGARARCPAGRCGLSRRL